MALGFRFQVLRTPAKGVLVTYNRSIPESQRVKGLRSKLSPKEIIALALTTASRTGRTTTVMKLRPFHPCSTRTVNLTHNKHTLNHNK